MKVGLIGLGRTGEGISRRMIGEDVQVWGYGKNYQRSEEIFEKGYVSGVTTSLGGLVQIVKQKECIYGEKSGETIYTEQPGIFLLVLPSESVEDTIDELLPLLGEGDIIIDYSDSDVEKCQEIELYCSKLGVSYIFSGVYGAVYAIDACSKIFECLSPGKIG